MIARVTGRLVVRAPERVEVATEGGVTYELAIPLGTFESLPREGETVTLHTHVVIREDDWALYGFATGRERAVFRRLLGAKGVGPGLALGMLSRFSPDRLVRAIREKDVDTLQAVPRVGRKKAQQLVLDLADQLDDLGDEPGAPGPAGPPGAEDAVRALVALGVTAGDAERAVREALAERGPAGDLAALIRAALARTKT